MADDRAKLLAKFIEPLRVEPGSKVKLAKDFLADNGFKVMKLFLNLSKEEQRIRFLRRAARMRW